MTFKNNGPGGCCCTECDPAPIAGIPFLPVGSNGWWSSVATGPNFTPEWRVVDGGLAQWQNVGAVYPHAPHVDGESCATLYLGDNGIYWRTQNPIQVKFTVRSDVESFTFMPVRPTPGSLFVNGLYFDLRTSGQVSVYPTVEQTACVPDWACNHQSGDVQQKHAIGRNPWVTAIPESASGDYEFTINTMIVGALPSHRPLGMTIEINDVDVFIGIVSGEEYDSGCSTGGGSNFFGFGNWQYFNDGDFYNAGVANYHEVPGWPHPNPLAASSTGFHFSNVQAKFHNSYVPGLYGQPDCIADRFNGPGMPMYGQAEDYILDVPSRRQGFNMTVNSHGFTDQANLGTLDPPTVGSFYFRCPEQNTAGSTVNVSYGGYNYACRVNPASTGAITCLWIGSYIDFIVDFTVVRSPLIIGEVNAVSARSAVRRNLGHPVDDQSFPFETNTDNFEWATTFMVSGGFGNYTTFQDTALWEAIHNAMFKSGWYFRAVAT